MSFLNTLQSNQNKTSIQWTPGSQIYLSSKKMFLDKNDFWTEKLKNAQIMHNSCLIILVTNTILIDLLHNTLPKLHVKLQPHPLKNFRAKVEKEKKRINYA